MNESVSEGVGDWTDGHTCPGCFKHGAKKCMLSFKVSLTMVSEQMVDGFTSVPT